MNKLDDSWIISNRGRKNTVNPFLPHAYHVEKEYFSEGIVEEVATIFLTNKECPFHCLMCDLWKNTTDYKVAIGAIPQQISWALQRLPETKHLKLYNSGNFFDAKAIPYTDYDAIASLMAAFETLIIECHPKFINKRCLKFNLNIKPRLQVAIGLETVHTGILPLLNKKMTLIDFQNSVYLLKENDIEVRTFILLGLPFLSIDESIHWAKKSLAFALGSGSDCCVIIPTRSGNGTMDELNKKNFFSEQNIPSLEEVLEFGLQLNKGKVFADLWDLEHFSTCITCFEARKSRLQEMNLTQRTAPPVNCDCHFSRGS